MSLDPELESFKHLDLRVYAAAQGYALDRKKSWRGSAVMRHTNHDLVVIKLGPDNHWVYFSLRDDNDHGSIIDFVKNRGGGNLGNVRKRLRAWAGTSPSPALPVFERLEVTSKDRAGVEQRFYTMAPARSHAYLEQVRRIPAALLASPRFIGRIRTDARNNAVFPHYDAGGLSGYEVKNRNFTGFATGGEKGIWMAHSLDGDNCLVFAESAIDALSYAALFPDPHARYISIGGKMNPQQPFLVAAEMIKLPNRATVIAAMDNDNAGTKLSNMIEMTISTTGRQDLTFRSHAPSPPAKDWNDVLVSAGPKSLFPPAV